MQLLSIAHHDDPDKGHKTRRFRSSQLVFEFLHSITHHKNIFLVHIHRSCWKTLALKFTCNIAFLHPDSATSKLLSYGTLG